MCFSLGLAVQSLGILRKGFGVGFYMVGSLFLWEGVWFRAGDRPRGLRL